MNQRCGAPLKPGQSCRRRVTLEGSRCYLHPPFTAVTVDDDLVITVDGTITISTGQRTMITIPTRDALVLARAIYAAATTSLPEWEPPAVPDLASALRESLQALKQRPAPIWSLLASNWSATSIWKQLAAETEGRPFSADLYADWIMREYLHPYGAWPHTRDARRAICAAPTHHE